MNTLTFDDDEIEHLRQRIEAVHAQKVTGLAPVGLIPLKLTCWMASCKHGRHCLDYLRKPRKGAERIEPGRCRDCGEQIVDLPHNAPESVLAEREELSHTIIDQQSELIRAHYWHVPIDQWAYNSARRLGKAELRRRIEARVLAALVAPGPFDGRSASYSKDIIAYAQHATATCCRRCASYWHGLPNDANIRPTEAQVRHVLAIASAWVDVRLPDLSPVPERHVNQIRRDILPSRETVNLLDENLMNLFAAGTDPAGLLMPDSSNVQVADTRSSLLLLPELNLT